MRFNEAIATHTATGAAFLSWVEPGAGTTSLWALGRGGDSEDGSSPHRIVSRPKAAAPGRSQLAVGPAGDAFVTWREAAGADWNVYHCAYRRASRQWDAPALFRFLGGAGQHASA